MKTSQIKTATEVAAIDLVDPKTGYSLYETPEGLEDIFCKIAYPFKNGAYRLVNNSNYTSNFGFEWNIFQKTQIDS